MIAWLGSYDFLYLYVFLIMELLHYIMIASDFVLRKKKKNK